jgi:hypothetical protein
MAAPPTIPVDAERQLPVGEEIFLDHVGHFVADAEAASRAMTRAGFAPTPISIQSDGGQLTGTGNVTAMMQRGYIEVLFKTADTALGREFEQARARHSGLHLIAFAVADAKAARDQLASTGFRVRPIVELRRPVATATGEAEAAFTVTRVEDGEMHEGRIQYLTHHTEDAVWQKRWLAHKNGAKALLDVVVAVSDVDEAAARYVRFLRHEAVPTNMGRGIFLERGGVQLVNGASFSRLLPGTAVPSLPFIGAYAVRVNSLAVAGRELRASGLRVEERGPMLAAAFPAELGVGAWLFVEHATDLPWRSRS